MNGQMNQIVQRVEHSLALILEAYSRVQEFSLEQSTAIFDEAIVLLLRWCTLDAHRDAQWLKSTISDDQTFRCLCVQVVSMDSSASISLLQGGLFHPRLTPYCSTMAFNSDVMDKAIEHLFDVQESKFQTLSMSPNDLSALFQMLLEREVIYTAMGWSVQKKSASKRKGTGAYYTPEILVSSVLDATITRLIDGINAHYTGDEAISRLLALRVCEPSCGGGVFLVATVRRIAEAIYCCAVDSQSSLQSWKQQVAMRCVFGVDINPIAVALCQYALWVEVGEASLPVSIFESQIQCGNALLWSRPDLVEKGIDANHFELVSGDVPRIRNSITKRCREESRYPMIDIDAHSSTFERAQDVWLASLFWPKMDEEMVSAAPTQKVLLDTLTSRIDGDVLSKIQMVRDENGFFQWESRFSEVMTDGGFDAVIGNPPYLASRYLSKHHPHLRKALPKMYRSASGNWDIYIPFTELAFHLLKEGGFQAYVTPNKIIGSEYASVLQTEFFFENTMLEVHDFTRLNLFDGANVSVVVVVNQKICSLPEHSVCFFQYRDDSTVSVRKTISLCDLKALPHGYISFPLTASNPEMLRWMKHPTCLADICELSDGMSTDQAYRIQPLIQSGTQDDWECEETLKLVNTGTIDPFTLKWGHQAISFLGYKGLYPILSSHDLQAKYPKRYQQSQQVTIAIAGLSNRIEAVVLPKGFISGVATVLLQPIDGICPYALSALLNSPTYSELYKGLFGMSGMTADILNYSAKPMGYLPIPRLHSLRSTQSRLSQLGVLLHNIPHANDHLQEKLLAELERVVSSLLQ